MCVPQSLIRRLRDDGHVVFSIREESPGIPGEEVLSRALEDSAVLLTFDKDFGDLVYRQWHKTDGVVLIRLPAFSPIDRNVVVSATIRMYGTDLAGSFTVIGPIETRLRPLPTFD